MELYIYNPSIEQLGVIDSFSSLRWRRRFFEPGEFELHCPATADNLALLAEGNIIARLDRCEAGVIEGMTVESTDESGDELTVTGRMGSSLLDRRIIIPAISFTGSTETAMRKIVSDNAIAARPIPGLILGTPGNFTSACSFQAAYKGVLETLEALGKAAPLGFRLRLDVPNKAWIFEAYEGADKTITQTERPYVLFSDGFGNISGPKYTLDSTGCCNFAYVGGEEKDGTRTFITVDRTNGEPQRELWVDAKDLKKGELSDADYQAQLTQRGLEKLSGTGKAESFEASAVNTTNFQYRSDWDLGDIVSFEKWGLRLDQRITEVEETYEGGVETVTPTCGTPLPEKLNLGDDT